MYTVVTKVTFCVEPGTSSLIGKRRRSHSISGQTKGHYKLLWMNPTRVRLTLGELETHRQSAPTPLKKALSNRGTHPHPSFCEAVEPTTTPPGRFECSLLICDHRPPDGHSYDRPRDAAFREHHGQIHHLAPPAQLPHGPVQQAAADGEHAGVR